MKKLLAILAALVAGVVLSTASASAQEQPSEVDTTFLTKNQQTNLAEITMGTMAMEQGTDHVKQMGQQIVADHEEASQRNQQVSETVGVTPPTEPNEMQEQQAASLEGLTGEAFDAAWIQIQIEGHRMSLADTDTELSSGTNPEVMGFAEWYRPVAQRHLDMAMGMMPSPTGGVDAGAGGTTGVRADTEEPTWVIPFVAAFVAFGVVCAVLAGRRRDDTRA
jgi:putative membrane protein